MKHVADTKSYEDRVREQVAQYKEDKNIHALPDVFHVWSGDYVRPGIDKVFGVRSITEFYVEAFVRGLLDKNSEPVYLSLGCGDGVQEIEIAKGLQERGILNFCFVCCDLSGILLNRFKGKIPRELTRNFELVESDLNGRNFSTKFDAIMANHSLHHMVNLEKIFSITYQNLSEHGVFVTNDMIGRNGHMRWPETQLFVDFFWPFLAQHQRRNVLLERIEAKFMDHDCSTEGFEGIRSQDILKLILYQGFLPWKFFGTGGFIDVFVDRSFGHNFDATNSDDLFLIKRMGLLNDILLDVGLIKPTVMFAYFVKHPVAEINYNNRSAFRSVRDTGNDPVWITEAISEAARYQCSGDYMYRAPLISAKNHR